MFITDKVVGVGLLLIIIVIIIVIVFYHLTVATVKCWYIYRNFVWMSDIG